MKKYTPSCLPYNNFPKLAHKESFYEEPNPAYNPDDENSEEPETIMVNANYSARLRGKTPPLECFYGLKGDMKKIIKKLKTLDFLFEIRYKYNYNNNGDMGMDFFKSWTIDNILSSITIIIMATGGFFALIQWNSTIKIKRTEFLDDVIKKLRFDKDMAKAMYTIDYNSNWYNENFHDSVSDLEYLMDRFLSYIDYICYLYSMKNISYNEFSVMKYEINRVCISPSVQAYLWNLYHFSKRMKTDCSFAHIIDYGIKEKIIKNEFKINNIDMYRKYLNF